MGITRNWWEKKKAPVLRLAEALQIAEDRKSSFVRCNLLAIVADTEGPMRAKGRAGFKRE